MCAQDLSPEAYRAEIKSLRQMLAVKERVIRELHIEIKTLVRVREGDRFRRFDIADKKMVRSEDPDRVVPGADTY